MADISKFTFGNNTWNFKDSKARGTWTTPTSASVGATSKTISDANIKTTSNIAVYFQNSNGTPITFTGVAVTNGKAVLSFEALTVATDFKLHILD